MWSFRLYRRTPSPSLRHQMHSSERAADGPSPTPSPPMSCPSPALTATAVYRALKKGCALPSLPDTDDMRQALLTFGLQQKKRRKKVPSPASPGSDSDDGEEEEEEEEEGGGGGATGAATAARDPSSPNRAAKAKGHHDGKVKAGDRKAGPSSVKIGEGLRARSLSRPSVLMLEALFRRRMDAVLELHAVCPQLMGSFPLFDPPQGSARLGLTPSTSTVPCARSFSCPDNALAVSSITSRPRSYHCPHCCSSQLLDLVSDTKELLAFVLENHPDMNAISDGENMSGGQGSLPSERVEDKQESLPRHDDQEGNCSETGTNEASGNQVESGLTDAPANERLASSDTEVKAKAAQEELTLSDLDPQNPIAICLGKNTPEALQYLLYRHVWHNFKLDDTTRLPQQGSKVMGVDLDRGQCPHPGWFLHCSVLTGCPLLLQRLLLGLFPRPSPSPLTARRLQLVDGEGGALLERSPRTQNHETEAESGPCRDSSKGTVNKSCTETGTHEDTPTETSGGRNEAGSTPCLEESSDLPDGDCRIGVSNLGHARDDARASEENQSPAMTLTLQQSEQTVFTSSSQQSEQTAVSSSPQQYEQTTVTSTSQQREQTAVTSSSQQSEQTAVTSSLQQSEQTAFSVTSSSQQSERAPISSSSQQSEQTAVTSSSQQSEQTAVSSSPEQHEQTVVTSSPQQHDQTAATSSSQQSERAPISSSSQQHKQTAVTSSSQQHDQTAVTSSLQQSEQTAVSVTSSSQQSEQTAVSSSPEQHEQTVVTSSPQQHEQTVVTSSSQQHDQTAATSSSQQSERAPISSSSQQHEQTAVTSPSQRSEQAPASLSPEQPYPVTDPQSSGGAAAWPALDPNLQMAVSLPVMDNWISRCMHLTLTPLHLACWRCDPRSIRVLLACGADANRMAEEVDVAPEEQRQDNVLVDSSDSRAASESSLFQAADFVSVTINSSSFDLSASFNSLEDRLKRRGSREGSRAISPLALLALGVRSPSGFSLASGRHMGLVLPALPETGPGEVDMTSRATGDRLMQAMTLLLDAGCDVNAPSVIFGKTFRAIEILLQPTVDLYYTPVMPRAGNDSVSVRLSNLEITAESVLALCWELLARGARLGPAFTHGLEWNLRRMDWAFLHNDSLRLRFMHLAVFLGLFPVLTPSQLLARDGEASLLGSSSDGTVVIRGYLQHDVGPSHGITDMSEGDSRLLYGDAPSPPARPSCVPWAPSTSREPTPSTLSAASSSSFSAGSQQPVDLTPEFQLPPDPEDGQREGQPQLEEQQGLGGQQQGGRDQDPQQQQQQQQQQARPVSSGGWRPAAGREGSPLTSVLSVEEGQRSRSATARTASPKGKALQGSPGACTTPNNPKNSSTAATPDISSTTTTSTIPAHERRRVLLWSLQERQHKYLLKFINDVQLLGLDPGCLRLVLSFMGEADLHALLGIVRRHLEGSAGSRERQDWLRWLADEVGKQATCRTLRHHCKVALLRALRTSYPAVLELPLPESLKRYLADSDC